MAKFGLKAEVSGRNDINIFNKKVSGSAFKIKLGDKEGRNRRSLHHGTMLLDIDLSNLKKYLNPNKLKLISKGVDSVLARVVNICEHRPEVDHEAFCKSLSEAF